MSVPLKTMSFSSARPMVSSSSRRPARTRGPEAQAHTPWPPPLPSAHRSRSTAACWSRLPCCQSTSKSSISSLLAANRGDVDLSRQARHSGESRPRCPTVRTTWPGLGLARHAIGGVHRGAEDVLVLEHDRSEMAADADRDVLALDRECRVRRRCPAASRPRHSPRRSPVGKIARISSPIVLMTVPRLRSVELAHQVHAGDDHVPREVVAQELIQPGAAHDVGEQDRDFRLGTQSRG